MKHLLLFTLLAAFSACSSEPGGGNAGPAPPLEGRWDCAGDGDCVNSCKLGAVSGAWYERNATAFVECDDGCANQVSGPPRCIGGQCAAFDHEGKPRPYCTRKDADR